MCFYSALLSLILEEGVSKKWNVIAGTKSCLFSSRHGMLLVFLQHFILINPQPRQNFCSSHW